MIVTVTNPVNEYDAPIYEGDPGQAYDYLIPGKYHCTFTGSDDRYWWGALVVTPDWSFSHLVPYGHCTPAGNLGAGDRIEFHNGVEMTQGTIVSAYFNDRGGMELRITDPHGTLYERCWHEQELVDLAPEQV